MTISANAIWEVESGGSDTNGGGFDPSIATGVSDFAATSATGSSPVVTSATYTFVAGDVGNWIFIKSGTNWVPGWYKISSVATGAATVNAAVGAVILYNGTTVYNTVAGIASVASPTAGTGSVDYTQTTTAKLAATGASSSTTTVTLGASGFTQVMVGNSLYLSGTGITTGWYFMTAYTSATVCTVDRSPGTTGSAVVVNVGGAFASPAIATSAHVGGNKIHIKAATYTITSASTNVAGGCLVLLAGVSGAETRLIGYQTLRNDLGTRPLLQASAISTFTLVAGAGGTRAVNIALDGASLTSSRGFSSVATCYKCKASNCTNSAYVTITTAAILCEGTGCSSSGVFNNATCYFCTGYSNTVTVFRGSNCIYCIASNNTGASTHGYDNNSNAIMLVNCIAYNNGAEGFHITGTSSGNIINCIATNNASYGFNIVDAIRVINCAGFSNNPVNTNGFTADQLNGFITLTATPFNNAAGNDFSLNNTAGGGASCRNAGIPTTYPGLSTTSNISVGATELTASGGSSSVAKIFGSGLIVPNRQSK